MIIMIDSETTALSTDKGVIRELAFASDMGDRFTINFPTTEAMWDADTLRWTKRNGSFSAADFSTLTSGHLKDERRAAICHFALEFNELIEGQDVKIVMKHPEFDIPFIEQAGYDIRAAVGHRNIYDMDSLLVGYYGGAYPDHPTQKMIEGAYKAAGKR